MEIKHLSLDIWRTIFKANPAYTEARAQLVSMTYFTEEHSEYQINFVARVFKEVGAEINEFEYKYGQSIPYRFKHSMVLTRLGLPISVLEETKWKRLFSDLFLIHSPILVDDQIPDILNSFRPGHIVPISLVSNTQFVEGKVLLEALSKKGVNTARINCFFSDQSTICKPATALFYNVSLTSNTHRKDILHVGDDANMDIVPAESIGLQTFHLTEENNWSVLKSKLESNG